MPKAEIFCGRRTIGSGQQARIPTDATGGNPRGRRKIKVFFIGQGSVDEANTDWGSKPAATGRQGSIVIVSNIDHTGQTGSIADEPGVFIVLGCTGFTRRRAFKVSSCRRSGSSRFQSVFQG